MGIDIVSYRARIGSFGQRGSRIPKSILTCVFEVLNISCFGFLFLLLILCWDVETNPGPPDIINGFLLNTRSVKSVTAAHNKIAELRSIVSFYKAKIICLTETWLNSSVSSDEILPDDDFNIYRRDRDGHGGVLIAIHNPTIPSKLRTDLVSTQSTDFEILVVELNLSPNNKVALVNFYNSPTNPNLDRVLALGHTLRAIQNEGFHNICLMGDFNLPNLDIRTGTPLNTAKFCHEFYNVFVDFDLEHNVFVPTHRGGNRLDLIMSSVPETITDVFVEDIFPSDHFVVHFALKAKLTCRKKLTRTVLNYRKANWLGLREAIVASNLNRLIDSCNENVELACTLWSNKLQELVNKFIPKHVIKNINSPPWIDGEVVHMSNKKETARRKAHRINSENSWANYKKIRNKLRNLTNSKYIKYISDSVDFIASNPKRMWSLIRAKCKNKSIPDTVHHAGNKADNAKQKATIFNGFFFSNFTSDSDDMTYPDINVTNDPSLRNVTVHVADIRLILDSIDPSKATGPDEIPGRILKECSRELAPSICRLSNLSLSQGIFPHNWKMANVIPVFKKGDRHDCENYRPISLLSVVSKILERVVFNKIYDKLLPKITLLQHGFLKGRSTVTQLLSVIHDLNNNLDMSGQTDVIYLDFSKAFDSVSHKLLIHKLKSFGFHGPLLNWFSSYLSNRTQRVLIDGEASTWLPVLSGVPQGSILGPLLFVLFINDITDNISEGTRMALFADDAKIYRHILSIRDCLLLQSDLLSLEVWSHTWKMKFNASKCKVMSIARVMKILHVYYLNNTFLERVNEFNDLGVLVTSTLNWDIHIRTKVNKASQLLGMIKRSVGHHAPSKLKQLFYQTLVRPVIMYAAPVWYPNRGCVQLLESVQRRATKFILNDYQNSYLQRLQSCRLLPFMYYKEIIDLCFLYKAIHHFHDFDVLKIVHFYDNNASRTRQGTRHLLLARSEVRTEHAENFYSNRIVCSWNNLPDSIRNTRSSNKHVIPFKNKLYQLFADKTASHFNVDDICSWFTRCRCPRCRPC